MKKVALSSILLFAMFASYGQSTLTLGRGLTGTSYNTTAPVTSTLDTSQNYTWLKLQTVLKTSLGATTANGLLVQNTTAAANNAQQFSPAMTWHGSGWASTGGTSQTWDIRAYVAPAQGTTNSTAVWNLEFSRAGGTFNPELSISNSGFLSASNGVQGTVAGIATTSTDGLIARNNTAATSGVPVQQSPNFHLFGTGWSGSASQQADWIAYVLPVSGTSPITSKLIWASQVNSGGYTQRFGMADNGLFYLNGTALTGNQLVGANSGATGMEAKTLSGSAGVSITNTAGAIAAAVDQTFSPTWTGKHIFNNAATASSGTAQGMAITPSLTAAANNDVLAAVDVTPSYTDGAFTGVHNTILRGNYSALGQTTTDAIILRNTTAATSSVQQYSPGLTFMANAWNTAASASEALNYRFSIATQSGSFLSNGLLYLSVSQNGGAYAPVYQFDPYGNIVVAGGYSTYAGLPTSNDGLFMGTGFSATAGTPVYMSGRVRLNGAAWNTTSSASQPTDFIIENHPISGSAVTSKLVISSQINNGGYTELFALLNTGLFYLNGTAMTGNQIVSANSGATGMEAKTLSGSAGTGAVVTNGTGTLTFSNDTTTLETVTNFFPKGDTRYLKTTTAATTYQPLLGYTAANNANVVHLTGNENISGIKTFASAIAIGTTTVPTGYLFAINGNTIATSVTVKAEANWPDYVFSDKYRLRPLDEVASYLKMNHHLPDMPSAEEVTKNGQDLGAMNSKLVKKVEELTLYLIDKDKQLEEQKKIVADQQARLERIEKLLKIDSGN